MTLLLRYTCAVILCSSLDDGALLRIFRQGGFGFFLICVLGQKTRREGRIQALKVTGEPPVSVKRNRFDGMTKKVEAQN